MNEIKRFNDVCFCDGWFYFSAIEFNGLFRWNNETGKTEFVCFFDDELATQANLHSHVILHEKRMYFIPFSGRGISIYDLNSKKMDFVSMTDIMDSNANIAVALLKDNKIYLFPYYTRSNDFMVFDLESKEISTWNEMTIKVKKLGLNSFCDFFGAVLRGNELLMVIFGTGVVLKYNFEENNLKKMLFADYRFGNVSLVNDDYYITACDGCIYRLDEDGNLSLELNTESKERYFFKLCENNDYLYAVPCFGQHIFMKKNNSEWTCMEHLMPKEFERIQSGEPLIWGHANNGKKLFLFPKTGNGILSIENDKVSFCHLQMDREMDGIKNLLIRRSTETRDWSVINENGFITLKDYLSFIVE